MAYAALDNMRLTARQRRSPNTWSIGDLLDYSLDRRGKFVGVLRLVDVDHRELIGVPELIGGDAEPGQPKIAPSAQWMEHGILIRRSAIARAS